MGIDDRVTKHITIMIGAQAKSFPCNYFVLPYADAILYHQRRCRCDRFYGPEVFTAPKFHSGLFGVM